MNQENLIEWTFEIDLDIYNSACRVCEIWGTTIEDMTAAFVRFSVDPQNLSLVEAFLKEPQESERRSFINQQIFQGVLEIALHQRS